MTGSAPDDWIALHVDLPVEVAEAVASFLIDAGAPGVVTEERDEGCTPVPAGRARLAAPVPAAEHGRVRAAVIRYLVSLGEIEPAALQATVSTVAVPAVDWIAVARRHHRPIEVGRRLLIVPPWDVPAAAEREILVIEPGMAFGTGQHATTRGCLEAIEAALESDLVASALDVGTGSGVLALALARLGVARVVALDADPTVLPLARHTLERNGAGDVSLVGGHVGVVRATFDLVVANLLADVLVSEAAALAGTVAPAGRLVLSGILSSQTAHVRAAYPGWHLTDTRTAEGWQTLTLRRER